MQIKHVQPAPKAILDQRTSTAGTTYSYVYSLEHLQPAQVSPRKQYETITNNH
jgi:hypothetical protein